MKTRLVIILILIALVAIFFARNEYASRVRTGDTAVVDYIGMLEDGTVFDTSIRTEAERAGIFSQERTYKPLTFQVGNNQVIKGFENAVLGMTKAQTKKVTIPPAEAYGHHQDDLVIKNRKKTFQRDEYTALSVTDFQTLFRKEPALEEILNTPYNPLKLQVTAITPANVTLKNLAFVGQEIKLQGVSWITRVMKIENGIITFTQEPKVGNTLIVSLQDGGQTTGTVLRVGKDDYDVDLNHELAGKTLLFTITLLDLKKA